MLVELTRSDILNLIKTQHPRNYDSCWDYEEKGIGHLDGGVCEVWRWFSDDKFNKYSDEELFNMYKELRG